MIVSMYCWLKVSKDMRLSQVKNRSKLLENAFNPRAYGFVLSELWKSAKNRINSDYRPDDFDYYIRHMDEVNQSNKRFYFDADGNPPCNAYLRYENLEEEYRKVCGRLGIPYEKLPATKNKTRKNRKHYSLYYDDATRDFVTEKCKKEIECFGYTFEDKRETA